MNKELIAVHAAELANLHAKIGDLLAISAAAYGREQTQWVPVSAKIPNMPRRALVVAVNDDGEAFVTTAHYNGRNGWLGMSGYTLLDVSHWMPLPEPPTC